MQQQLSDGVSASGSLRIRTYEAGKLVRELGPFKNKVVSSSGYGRNLLARWMAGDVTYPIVITSASVGTGTNTPADSDTDLQTVSASGLAVTNASASNNVLSIDFFVPDASLSNTTFKEFGVYASGRLVARLLISPTYTKGAGQDTLFTYTLTLSG